MTSTPNLDAVLAFVQRIALHGVTRSTLWELTPELVSGAAAELAALRADAALGRLVRVAVMGFAQASRNYAAELELANGTPGPLGSARALAIAQEELFNAALQAAEAAGGEREP